MLFGSDCDVLNINDRDRIEKWVGSNGDRHGANPMHVGKVGATRFKCKQWLCGAMVMMNPMRSTHSLGVLRSYGSASRFTK